MIKFSKIDPSNTVFIYKTENYVQIVMIGSIYEKVNVFEFDYEEANEFLDTLSKVLEMQGMPQNLKL